MRQFTTRTGDFVFIAVVAGALIGAFVVNEGADWGWVLGAAFFLGWFVNELHRRHDEKELERIREEAENGGQVS